MRVRIFNVRYSPNLGDGVIAVRLERRLTSLLSNDRQTADVASIDLAGRQQFGDGLGGRRQAVLRLLGALPPWLSRSIVRVVLNRQLRATMVPRWRAELAGCDAVVFGGGQIFADQNLNFPLKSAWVNKPSASPKRPSATGCSRSTAMREYGGRPLNGRQLAWIAMSEEQPRAKGTGARSRGGRPRRGEIGAGGCGIAAGDGDG